MTHKNRIWADAALLLVALIWGSAFVFQRMVAGEVGVLVFNGLRFLVGALVLLPFAWKRQMSLRGTQQPPTPLSLRGTNQSPSPLSLQGTQQSPSPLSLRGELPKQSPGWRFYLSHNKATPLGVLAAGLLLAGGAAFQQAGLIYTTAGNAGFITGLYVVLIPILSLLIWRRAPASVIWIAAALSALGLYLLSTGGALRLNWGDGLVLVSAFFWALHVLLVGWIVTQMDALAFAVGQYLMCGLVSLALGFSFETSTLQGILQNWWSVAYTGILSVGLGYTLQVVAQRFAPPADTAIILSMEAVFAALSGWLILDERLAPLQLGGCAIMLAGMLLAQSDVLAKRSRLSSASGAVDE